MEKASRQFDHLTSRYTGLSVWLAITYDRENSVTPKYSHDDWPVHATIADPLMRLNVEAP